MKLKIQNDLDQFNTYLQFHLCQQVKSVYLKCCSKRRDHLCSANQTLSEALKGEQGQSFAVFVQSRYPLILVDEFQDTNQDQDDMLASIWRHPQRYQKKLHDYGG